MGRWVFRELPFKSEWETRSGAQSSLTAVEA